MLVELFIMYQLIMIGVFIGAYYTHSELMWAIALVLAGVLMVAGYTIETPAYTYNAVTGIYEATTHTGVYIYLSGINILFFALGLVYGIYDMYDKYREYLSFDKKER